MVSSFRRFLQPRCLALLQECGSMEELVQVHNQMVRNGLFFEEPVAAGKLLDFCTRVAGNLHYARKLFDQVPRPDTFAWNTIIRGHACSRSPGPALELFARMVALGGDCAAWPNSYTYTFVLKACAGLRAGQEGEHVHGFMVKLGADHDVFSANGLISMYAACDKIELARRMFETCTERDIVTWNAMLSGYVDCGRIDCARKLFDEMPTKGIISWNAMISGYINCGDAIMARKLFDLMPERNVESWNTLITGSARCGLLDTARELFDMMPDRNAVSWSAMISAYVQGDRPIEAIRLFEEMRKLRVKPNWATIVSLLSACAHLGRLEQGKHIHTYIERNKMKVDSIIGTALIDMYAKCGCIEHAFIVFDSLISKDIFSWTVMISGLAVNGHGEKALDLFNRLQRDGLRPNEVTFVGVLCACSHMGQVELTNHYFNSMRSMYGIQPQIEHYGCMIDALGRAGRLEEAVSLVEAIPASNNHVLWLTLLGACWIHGNVEIGEHVFKKLIELKPNDGGVYVLLSNIYAMKGKWNDTKGMRMLMKSKGLQKHPGRSFIDIHGITHEFFSGDKSHPRIEEICQMLEEVASRLKLLGYTPNTSAVLFDIEEEEKQQAISHHSEKLAIAFGLVCIDKNSPIRVVKNLRVCHDCHTVAKLISKAFAREIILRDRHVFHYFRDGLCSCKEYW
ncbi:hypothetical protein Taro_047712 [Colocasia esculenta]|uniref:DYW domain-containing protein n=1 Tax=Colocasia esculenta TaxID=4460 RepID=A0A843X1D4_COLES|nr:hypothetical protein [Colocasia esculenta]